MKIFYSPASPFVRKCLVVAEELGLQDRIELLDSAAHPINRDRNIIESNPLGQVPTFFTDKGECLFDSFVICQYLNHLAKGELFGDAETKWQVLKDHAAADGLMSAALVLRYETGVRPSELEWKEWTAGHYDKLATTMSYFEEKLKQGEVAINISSITLACALAYIDFRLGSYAWKENFPLVADFLEKFNQRSSMKNTVYS